MGFRYAITNSKDEAARGSRTEPALAIYADGDHHRLLVVDDDPMILDLTSIILTREGYEVQQADSTTKAIHFMQTRAFDLVLTDLHMPEMNGIVLLQWIKNYNPAIGVIIITGDPDASYVSSTVRYGVDDYLLKPFTRDILLAAVEHCLINRRLARLDAARPIEDRA